MKKIIIILTILMIFSVKVNAETLNEKKDYNVTINSINENKIYDVELKWENMNFIYSNNESYVWDSSTHDYTLKSFGKWNSDNNEISINNKSNHSVNVLFDYKSDKEYEDIVGTFSNSSLKLDLNESGNSELDLNGILSSSVKSYTKIGQVTVTIS